MQGRYFFWIIRLFVSVMLLLGVGVTTSFAGGGQHYANGAEDFVVGALPPPGTYLLNYLTLIQKDRLVDNSGNSAPVEFEADVVAEIPRLIWVSPYRVFGASWGMHLFLPFYSANVEVGTSSANPKSLVDSEDAGLGDIIFSPLILGWHFGPNFHIISALDVYAPTGDYDSDRAATQILSRNLWTFEPVFAVTYLWKGFDFSAKLMYDFNTKNDKYDPDGAGPVAKMDLSPGQEFHVDWALGYATHNGLRGGLVGYNYWQTTDDKINGTTVRNQKSRVGGLGAGIKYWPEHGRFSMTLKHYWEYGARNIATGSSTWFKVGYKF